MACIFLFKTKPSKSTQKALFQSFRRAKSLWILGMFSDTPTLYTLDVNPDRILVHHFLLLALRLRWRVAPCYESQTFNLCIGRFTHIEASNVDKYYIHGASRSFTIGSKSLHFKQYSQKMVGPFLGFQIFTEVAIACSDLPNLKDSHFQKLGGFLASQGYNSPCPKDPGLSQERDSPLKSYSGNGIETINPWVLGVCNLKPMWRKAHGFWWKVPQKTRLHRKTEFPTQKMWKNPYKVGPLPVISCKYSFRRFSFDIRWCCPLVFYCIFTDETSTMASCRNKNVAFLWRTLEKEEHERDQSREKNFMKHLSSTRSEIEDSTSFFVYSTANIYIPNHIVIFSGCFTWSTSSVVFLQVYSINRNFEHETTTQFPLLRCVLFHLQTSILYHQAKWQDPLS